MTKHRFEALEKRCQKLKKDRIMKKILFISIVLFFTFIFFYLSHQSDKEPVIAILSSASEEVSTQILTDEKASKIIIKDTK